MKPYVGRQTSYFEHGVSRPATVVRVHELGPRTVIATIEVGYFFKTCRVELFNRGDSPQPAWVEPAQDIWIWSDAA